MHEFRLWLVWLLHVSRRPAFASTDADGREVLRGSATVEKHGSMSGSAGTVDGMQGNTELGDG